MAATFLRHVIDASPSGHWARFSDYTAVQTVGRRMAGILNFGSVRRLALHIIPAPRGA